MKLIIVDEADNVLSVKDRSELKSTDIYRVARLIILNAEGQILLAQRAFAKEKDPGVWGLAVEGTVEDGEDYESNIRKEAEEEIGITLGTITRGPKFRMTGTYNHWCQVFIYRADLDIAALRLQESELAAVRWYDPAALLQEVQQKPEQFGYNFTYILEIVQYALAERKW